MHWLVYYSSRWKRKALPRCEWHRSIGLHYERNTCSQEAWQVLLSAASCCPTTDCFCCAALHCSTVLPGSQQCWSLYKLRSKINFLPLTMGVRYFVLPGRKVSKKMINFLFEKRTRSSKISLYRIFKGNLNYFNANIITPTQHVFAFGFDSRSWT